MAKITLLDRGAIIHPMWELNTKEGTTSPVKANHCDEGTSLRIILVVPGAPVPKPGEKWKCQVVDIKGKPGKRSGVVWVRPLERVFELKLSGVWCDEKTLMAAFLLLRDPNANVMFEGPAGSGKTTIVKALAAAAGMVYKKVSCGMIKKHSQLFGRVNAGTRKNRLQFIWEDSEAMDAIRWAEEHPDVEVLIHADEWTRMDEDARDGWLDVLEGSVRIIHLPNGDKIHVGKNVHFVASGNIGAGFTLRQQDNASRDRWVIFDIWYMPHEAELAHCLNKYQACPRDRMDICLQVINTVRDQVVEGTLEVTSAPSVRRSERLASLLAANDNEGKPQFEIPWLLEKVVCNLYMGSIKKKTSDKAKVHDAIVAKLQDLKVLPKAA
jgi:MoxR-like ATPase